MAQEDLLDGLLTEAASERLTPSDRLMARIHADADALQPRPAMQRRGGRSPGWLEVLADWFGGGLSLAGMSAAAVSGLYLGLVQPGELAGLAEAMTGSGVERVELLPDTASFWAME